jgi:CheY-like chemotaxis protein
LESSGYVVLVAQNGPEGLASFGANVIDAVIVDYEMPKMTGDRVASRMKRIKPNVPILMLSAHSELPKNKLARVDGFLCKGVSWPTVLTALDKLLQPRLVSFDRWWETWRHQASLSPGGLDRLS